MASRASTIRPGFPGGLFLFELVDKFDEDEESASRPLGPDATDGDGVARWVFPVPIETATWCRDSGERRDNLLCLSSTRWQGGGHERSARRFRGRCASHDSSCRRHADVDARVDVAACGCSLQIRTAPRLCLARLRGLRAYLDAVLGSDRGDSPLTDGADHAPETPTTDLFEEPPRLRPIPNERRRAMVESLRALLAEALSQKVSASIRKEARHEPDRG